MRARGCLIGLGAGLALAGAVAAVVGPSLFRQARSIYAPVGRMKREERDFDQWRRARPWQAPATPSLAADRLDAFLALRRDLRALDQRIEALQQAVPRGQRPGLRQIAGIMEGVSDLTAERLEAFRRHDMTPAEYRYLDRLVYDRWLRALRSTGADPAARERAARDVEAAAEEERDAAVRARLVQLSREMRDRAPAAPEGIPADLHRRLLDHADEIEAEADAGRIRRGPDVM